MSTKNAISFPITLKWKELDQEQPNISFLQVQQKPQCESKTMKSLWLQKNHINSLLQRM